MSNTITKAEASGKILAIASSLGQTVSNFETHVGYLKESVVSAIEVPQIQQMQDALLELTKIGEALGAKPEKEDEEEEAPAKTSKSSTRRSKGSDAQNTPPVEPPAATGEATEQGTPNPADPATEPSADNGAGSQSP